jgi:signal peptidase II
VPGEAGEESVLKSSAPLLGLLATAVLAVDQATKHVVMGSIPLGASVPLVADVLRFTHIRNRGVAFGLLGDRGIPFVLVSIVAMLLIVLSLRRVPRSAHMLRYSLAAILGGASGNLIDRVRFREVVDFIEVGVGRLRWPVFNIADVAVTTGVALFIFGSLWGRPRTGGEVAADAGATGSGSAAGRYEAGAGDDSDREPARSGGTDDGGTSLGSP